VTSVRHSWSAFRRRSPLHTCLGDSPPAGPGAWLPAGGRRSRGPSFRRAYSSVRVQPLVDLDGPRPRPKNAKLRVVGEHADHVSSDVRQRHLRGAEDDARLATDGRRPQSDHTPGNRGSRPDVRDRVNGPDQLATSRLRRTHRRLRPDHDASVSEQGMKATRRPY
jgi:hypothetical protein